MSKRSVIHLGLKTFKKVVFLWRIYKLYIVGINLDDEMLELEKVRTVVASWLDALENQVKESMCSIEEQLGIANSVDRELFDNGRMLDFNSVMD